MGEGTFPEGRRSLEPSAQNRSRCSGVRGEGLGALMLGTWACRRPQFPQGQLWPLRGWSKAPGRGPFHPPSLGTTSFEPPGWDWVRQGQGELSHLRAPSSSSRWRWHLGWPWRLGQIPAGGLWVAQSGEGQGPSGVVRFGVSRGLHPHFLGDTGAPSQHPLEEWTGGGSPGISRMSLLKGEGAQAGSQPCDSPAGRILARPPQASLGTDACG